MTDTASTPVNELVDRAAVDADGNKIGTVCDVYADTETGQPEWLAVNTGLFGTKVSFVPIAGTSVIGDDVQVAYSKDLVKDAPRAEADGQLSVEEEDALYAHYGRQTTTERSTKPSAGKTSTGDAMTRSEEELDFNTTTRQTGVVRLRKWVETENVTMTVPVRKEKARMVTEPITDANRGEAMSGPDITEGEHEVVLSEEVVDVQKTVVPKERVRLETEVETDEVTVDEAVRKERIAMDDERK